MAVARLRVSMMSDDAARRRWDALAADPVESGWCADEIQALADRLGIPIRWQHLGLNDPDKGWQEGRYDGP